MKDIRQCNFCDKEAIMICDYINSKDELKKFAGCDEHKYLALSQQKQEIGFDEMRNRFTNFRKQII